MTGGELQDACYQLAHANGWIVAHFRPAKTKHGWRTAVAYDGKGFPDLLCVHARRGRVIFREIKGDREPLSLDQQAWADALTQAGADYAVWRPRDWQRVIIPILTFGRGVGL